MSAKPQDEGTPDPPAAAPDPGLAALSARLERLRANRAPKRREAVLADVVRTAQSALRRTATRNGATVEAWRCAAPESLVDAVRVLGWRRGRLELAVDDASMRFELERWLREGGERALGAAMGRAIGRVRVIVQATE